ncbi:GAF domain-containing protein [Rhodococcus sp. HM1]|uniref:sigma-54-dependent Fis family transcriptional regulator n=1 Tax=unclassified Rhodococcus (in: high G+C Gram-positive bacteria) TaxID=192944 RepID=UPI0018CD0653|nr:MULTISPECIES: helix-turn-helix domain-containing protein [unclassified Rhodococcus (in: high G+C Gram-positive bacteria)]MBH0123735.1 GAF domain-containing protein [Rhodococcus sp. CX]MCK8671159.1 GAF domain-containing protein [Rhodococcus sp. HM1]
MKNADRRLTVAVARAGFLDSGEPDESLVSPLVSASWQRSQAAGVQPSGGDVGYVGDVDRESRLVQCAMSVFDRLAADMVDVPVSIALTDAKAQVLMRIDGARGIGRLLDRVSLAPGFDYREAEIGTNGVGTVLESGQAVQIDGAEHFHDRFQPFACSGAPIRDPFSGHIAGVVDLSCLSEHSSPLLASVARSAASEIELNLFRDRSARQHALFDAFVRADARGGTALLATGSAMSLANPLAHAILAPEDQRRVGEHVDYMIGHRDRIDEHVELPDGVSVRVRAVRIRAGEDTAGYLIEVSESAAAAAAIPAAVRPTAPPRVPSHGAGLAAAGTGKLRAGGSPLWTRTCNEIEDAVRTGERVLVTGEPGTGKASLASEIFHSVVPGGRSILVDGSTDLSGLTDDSPTPTLYVLRNIRSMPEPVVATLAAALAKPCPEHVFVVATMQDSDEPAPEFLAPLLDALERTVHVPALRHRTDDIPGVVAQVLRTITGSSSRELTPDAMRLLVRYPWPRNIHELEDALRSAVALRPAGRITREDLPEWCHHGPGRKLSAVEAVERDVVAKALRDAGGNRAETARALGISRSSLYRKLAKFGLADAAEPSG